MQTHVLDQSNGTTMEPELSLMPTYYNDDMGDNHDSKVDTNLTDLQDVHTQWPRSRDAIKIEHFNIKSEKAECMQYVIEGLLARCTHVSSSDPMDA